MKILMCMGLSGMAVMLAGQPFAQTTPCDGQVDVPESADIQGAAQFEIVTSSNCKGPAVDTSFGPYPLMDSQPVVDTVKVLVSDTEVEEPVVEEEVGGIRQDLNDQQMRRLGELDAVQRRPLNMLYAGDLGYLQGYTEGQRARQVVPGRVSPPNEPRRGFVGF